MAQQNISPGEEKAWEMLLERHPDEVCRNALVAYDRAAGLYRLQSLDMEFTLDPHTRSTTSADPGSALLLGRLAYFFKLSVPWYLVSAKDIAFTGRLIKPANLAGGQLFFQGSHVLPLENVAAKYGNDREGFLKKGEHFGGERMSYGDISFRFFPLPRVPVTLILWLADEEFPPRVDLLFDSTCELQLPLDIIWSIAMMTLLVML